MRVSPNFTLAEFNRHNEPITPQIQARIVELANNLEVLRSHLNASITINSGYRSSARNAAVKGAANSVHLTGGAADIRVAGHTPKQVYDAIEFLISQGRMKQGGLGLYNTWVHYDTRGTAARWNKTK